MAYIGNKADTAFTSLLKQDLTGASGTSLTLTHAVANANDIALYINNVRQEPTEAYTVNGTTVTLTGSVAGTDDIYVIYLARAVQTTVPPDGSVSSAKIANSAVDLTSKVTGVLPVANGGTGSSSGAISTFTSAETTISASTKTTLAHSLGAIPFQFDLYLICKTAADGYVVGDIIKVTQSYHSTAGTSDIGAIMSADATNIYLTTGANAAGGMFKGFNQDTGAGVTFSNSNYKMIVKAWL